jgi:hypothetical protein
MADDKSAMIKAWQNKLLAAFSQNGTPGGRFLANAIAEEQKTGAEFMDKYYGHRVLTDSFMEFFERLFIRNGLITIQKVGRRICLTMGRA